jgi:hypothetical protein
VLGNVTGFSLHRHTSTQKKLMEPRGRPLCVRERKHFRFLVCFPSFMDCLLKHFASMGMVELGVSDKSIFNENITGSTGGGKRRDVPTPLLKELEEKQNGEAYDGAYKNDKGDTHAAYLAE